jgi:uncharacterized protein YndB with AHSA1/START domain
MLSPLGSIFSRKLQYMPTFSESITIHAPATLVWSTLADIGSIHKWNPGVEQSYQTNGTDVGLGATRHCRLGGKYYLDEEVVQLDPGYQLTFRIIRTNLPFERADIRFVLNKVDSGNTVTVSPEYRLKYGALGTVLNLLFVRRQYGKGMRGLLQGLKAHVEASAQTPGKKL